MLERGFHRSFAEIFDLIKQQEDRRLAAGPDSNLWSQRPLTEEPEKLDVMRNQLVEAESAMLLGKGLDYLFIYVNDNKLQKMIRNVGLNQAAIILRYSAHIKPRKTIRTIKPENITHKHNMALL